MSVLHVQLEGLYASLEKKRRLIKNRPIILIDFGQVFDFCVHCKKHGIRRGLSSGHAQNIVPGAFITELDINSYEELQLDILPQIASNFSPDVEVTSPDSIFLRLSKKESARRVVNELSSLLFEKAGGHRLTAGLAKNKFLAHCITLALQKNFLDGYDLSNEKHSEETRFFQLEKGKERDFIRDLPVTFLWPISDKNIARLEKLGLKSIGEIEKINKELLSDHFNFQDANRIYEYSRGKDSSEVSVNYPRPRTKFEKRLRHLSHGHLKRVISEAADYLSEELLDMEMGGTRIVLEISVGDKKVKRHRKCPRPIFDEVRIEEVLWGLIEKILPKLKREEAETELVILQTVISQLRKQKFVQESFFSVFKTDNREEVREILWELNDKYARRIIFWGEQFQSSYRERRLAFWDPVRREENENAAFDGSSD